MAFPTWTVDDLADFSGRSASTYPDPYTDQAIAMATLLFRFASCLTESPEDADEALLVKYAVLALADTLILTQPYAKAAASPFSSETIGSYSYSKSQQARAAISAGTGTGVLWFDMAVQQLGVCENGVCYGGIEVMEFDAIFGQPVDSANARVLGPQDPTYVDRSIYRAVVDES